MLPCDMDDNTFILLDFGEAFYGFVYGAAAGSVVRGRLAIHGTSGTIEGNLLNGNPIDAPDGELPHVVGPHRSIQESHVYEDIMQLVDWIREDKPTIVTAEHGPARHRNFRCGGTGRHRPDRHKIYAPHFDFTRPFSNFPVRSPFPSIRVIGRCG